jgi:3-hydroxyisobutyrate dehydrogenase
MKFFLSKPFPLSSSSAALALRASIGGSSSHHHHHHRRAFSTTRLQLARYAFIGLGNMGLPMASNLCRKLGASDAVAVFDMSAAIGARMVGDLEGVAAETRVASSAADAAKDADVVITALPAAAHVTSVVASIVEDPSANPSRLFIDCSTIDPAESRAIAASIPPTHGRFVDAPMSGGVHGAALGTLTFMLGSPDQLIDEASRTLQHMGSRVLHCGPNGAGLAAKLANNYVLAVENIAVAEAMDLGIRLGVDAKVLAGVLNVSTARCWSSEVNNPVPGVVDTAPATREYENGFAVALMSKDLGLVQAARASAGAGMPFLKAVRETYADLEKRGWGRRDFSIVYKHVAGGD